MVRDDHSLAETTLWFLKVYVPDCFLAGCCNFTFFRFDVHYLFFVSLFIKDFFLQFILNSSITECLVVHGFVEVHRFCHLWEADNNKPDVEPGYTEQIKLTQLSRARQGQAEMSRLQSGSLSSSFPAVLPSTPHQNYVSGEIEM